MKRLLLSIFLFLITTSAFCSSPSMADQQQRKKYTRKSTPVLTVPTLPPQKPEIPRDILNIRKQPLIIIDPGHGGDDFGTNSLGSSKYHEKYLNLTTSQFLRGFLKQLGYRVILTRTDDTFIALDQRADFANKKNADLFVSIHYNSAPSREADGIEIFYYQDNASASRTKQSKALARDVLGQILQQTQAKSRGVKQGNLAVIRETKMPAILIEGGFMTNAVEMEKIKKSAYQKSIAQGIAQGIQEYLVSQGKAIQQ